MCKGPVVVGTKAGARVKEGWCDQGQEWDGQDEGEGIACLWMQQLGGQGNGEAMRLGFYFRDCGLGLKCG